MRQNTVRHEGITGRVAPVGIQDASKVRKQAAVS
jgi:hypothetical protein